MAMWKSTLKIILLLLIVLVSSCSSQAEIEESVIIYDNDHFGTVVRALHEQKIKFRIGDGLVIWHPVSERSRVKKVLSEQAAVLPAEYVIKERVAYKEFIRKLELQNIQYSLNTDENGSYLISVPREKQGASSKIFHEVFELAK